MYWNTQDLRYGTRLLWKARGFTSAALAALALGIGATVAIFSVLDAVLLKPLPFHDPDRVVVVWEENRPLHRLRMFAAGANFLEWQARSRMLQAFAAIVDTRLNLNGGPNGHIDPEELKAERVSAGLFPLLGVQPVVGRAFRPEEDTPGRAGPVLISCELWQRRFAGDAAMAGKPIRLRDRSYTVIGILPAGFSVLEPGVDIWLPLGLDGGDARAVNARNLAVVARLRPGLTLAQARAEMAAIGDGLESAKPALDRGWRPSLLPIMEELAGDVRRPLEVLLAAVGLLLLIACANVANLLLARGAARRRELAIRTAVGAGRGRIALQLLSESLLLALAGGALGLALARGAIALVVRWGPASVPRLASARLDARLLLFALAVSVLTGVLFGIAPAIQLSFSNLSGALMEGGRGATVGRSGRYLRNSLVVSEIALALVLLIGAGLLVRGFARLRGTSPGFDPSNRLTFRVPMAGGRNSATPRRIAFLDQITARMAVLPGVRAVGAITTLPMAGLGVGSTFLIEGRPAPPPEERPWYLARSVTPGYFQAMGIPVVAGRVFCDADTSQSLSVVIVNRTLARRFWPKGSAPGGRLILDFAGIHAAEIVGVVGDVKSENIEKDDWPTVFFPYPQFPAMAMTVIIDTGGPPRALAAAAAREIHQLDPDQPLADVRTLDDIVGAAVAGPRFNATVLAIFGLLSFLLAAVGIYGVISYEVSERTHELGIRAALGAGRRDMLRLVLGRTARLAASGMVLGWLAAWALTRLMAAMIHSVSPRDFTTYASISLMLGVVALVAGYLPARRAMALDPLAALRHE
jgi:putative ABC transport system permease protein